MSQQGVAAARRIPNAETCDGILVQSAIFEVRPRRFPFQRPCQLLQEKRLRLSMHFHEHGALLLLFPFFRRMFLRPLQRDSAFLRHDAQRFRKLAPLHFHHKVEDIAALATPEAVKNLAHWMHVERRRLLRMEWTKPAEILPGLLKLEVFPYHADNVRLLLHLLRK